MMKKSLFYVALVAFFVAQQANAQDCDFYFPNKVGTKTETTHYDKKGKEVGVATVTILEKEAQKIKASSEFKAKDSETPMKSEVTVECKNGEFFLSMDAYTNQAAMSAYQNMDVEVDAQEISLPANLKSGQILNEGSVTITVKNNGIKIFSNTTSIKDRKVEGFEKVTTPAGTFDCVLITYTLETKVMFKKIKLAGKEWFAKNIGLVKTESYNKKGKLDSSSQLTKITK